MERFLIERRARLGLEDCFYIMEIVCDFKLPAFRLDLGDASLAKSHYSAFGGCAGKSQSGKMSFLEAFCWNPARNYKTQTWGASVPEEY